MAKVRTNAPGRREDRSATFCVTTGARAEAPRGRGDDMLRRHRRGAAAPELGGRWHLDTGAQHRARGDVGVRPAVPDRLPERGRNPGELRQRPDRARQGALKAVVILLGGAYLGITPIDPIAVR